MPKKLAANSPSLAAALYDWPNSALSDAQVADLLSKVPAPHKMSQTDAASHLGQIQVTYLRNKERQAPSSEESLYDENQSPREERDYLLELAEKAKAFREYLAGRPSGAERILVNHLGINRENLQSMKIPPMRHLQFAGANTHTAQQDASVAELTPFSFLLQLDDMLRDLERISRQAAKSVPVKPGPQKNLALQEAVGSLCQFWKAITGKEPTHSVNKYSSKSEKPMLTSPTDIFVDGFFTAVDPAVLPSTLADAIGAANQQRKARKNKD